MCVRSTFLVCCILYRTEAERLLCHIHSSRAYHNTHLCLLCHPVRTRNRDFSNLFFLFSRYHKIGLVVLFVHDIADIWLDLTKMLHYMGSRQGGRKCPGFENAASGSFIIFTLCWYVEFGNRFNLFNKYSI